MEFQVVSPLAIKTNVAYRQKPKADRAADWLLGPYRRVTGGHAYTYVARCYDRGLDYEGMEGGRYEPARREYDPEHHLQQERLPGGWSTVGNILTLVPGTLLGLALKQTVVVFHGTALQTALNGPIPKAYGSVYAPKGDTEAKLARQLTHALAQQDRQEQASTGSLNIDYRDQLALEALEIRNKPNQNLSASFDNLSAAVATSSREIGRDNRDKMEDDYLVTDWAITLEGQDYRGTLCGVFDGHSSAKPLGRQASQFVRERLPPLLNSILEREGSPLNPERLTNALCEACVTLDIEFRRRNLKCGTAITIVWWVAGTLYTANVGDCRALVIKRNACTTGPAEGRRVIQLSEDAKVSEPRFQESALRVWTEMRSVIEGQEPTEAERQRVIEGMTATQNPRFIDLQCVRDIGLTGLYHMTPRPKITAFPTEEGDLLVIASDGLWDVMNCSEVAVHLGALPEELSLLEQAEYLRNLAIVKESGDDIAVLLVRIPAF